MPFPSYGVCLMDILVAVPFFDGFHKSLPIVIAAHSCLRSCEAILLQIAHDFVSTGKPPTNVVPFIRKRFPAKENP
jgi:hypothetical protein